MRKKLNLQFVSNYLLENWIKLFSLLLASVAIALLFSVAREVYELNRTTRAISYHLRYIETDLDNMKDELEDLNWHTDSIEYTVDALKDDLSRIRRSLQ